MIQQLFPGRTRHQIKLKYKKEERQHPLQLSDAVNSRGKGKVLGLLFCAVLSVFIMHTLFSVLLVYFDRVFSHKY